MENLKYCEEALKQLLVVKPGVTLVLVGAYRTSAFRICGCNLGFVPVICPVMTVLIFVWGGGEGVLFCLSALSNRV